MRPASDSSRKLRRHGGWSMLPLAAVLVVLTVLGALIALQVAVVGEPSSPSAGAASGADYDIDSPDPAAGPAGQSAVVSGTPAAAASALPERMDLSRRAVAAGAKGPAVPTLTLPNALDLEAVFKPGLGRPVRLALAPDFIFEGRMTVRSEQADGPQIAVGASDGVSDLSLTRERRGRYRGFITHAGSPVAHRLSTGPGGELIVEQVLLSDILCAPTGAVGRGPVGLSAPPPDPAVVAAPSAATASAPVASVPAHDSLPSAQAVIYLDFDGQVVTGTEWNSYFSVTTINAAPSGKTAAQITQIWQAVADDFAPFNISVTTLESRFQSVPASRRIRVIVTPTAGWTGWGSGVIGVAFLGSFVWSGDTPCWAFDGSTSPAVTADTISHEVGHALNLKHDGKGTQEYYHGFENNLVSWNPIMGGGANVKLTQWSRGEYRQATQQEDDLAIIASPGNGFGVRLDDKGDTLATAALLRFQAGSSTTVADEGIIEKMTDVDIMRFNAGSGTVNLQVRGAEFSPNLFMRAELLDSSGAVLTSASSSKNQMDVSLSRNVAAGVYYLRVTGIGLPVPPGSSGPYDYDTSGYGSLGLYRVGGIVPTGTPVPVLSVDTTALTVTVEEGGNPPPQTFRVRNAGTGTINYTISENLDWLAVSPLTGASTGAEVVHSVAFSTASLAPGLYEGAIQISAPGAEGSPQSVLVTLHVTAPGADLVFENPAGIAVPDAGFEGVASPYPSVIEVSGVPATVTTVSVDLRGLSHDWPDDLDILLVAPNGQTVMLMSGAGGDSSTRLEGVDLTFRDEGTPLPEFARIFSGIYRPSAYRSSLQLPSGAPPGPYGPSLAATLSGGVNGSWRLYVADVFPGADDGFLAGGWSISFGTSTGALAPPTGVNATDGELRDRVRVTWNPVDGASGYRVFRALDNDAVAAGLIATVSEAAHDDFSAQPGVTYYYWVRAVDGDRVSALSAGDDGFRLEPEATNDDFINRIIIPATANPATDEVNSNTATKEPGEPDHAGNFGGKSVWWSWTAPVTATVTVSTQGSSFDTLLGVYTGGALGSLVEVTSDDDSGGNLTSRAVFSAAAGTTYQIAVDGFSGAGGRVVLSVSFDETPQPPPPPAAVQASDGAFNDRVRVSWSAAPNAQGYDIRRHTADDFSAATLLGTAGAGVLFFDDVSADPGTVYRYWVVARNAAGSSPPGGPATGFRAAGAGSNDNFAEAFPLVGGSAATTADNASATKEAGEPAHAGTSGGKSLWWKWTAPQDGSVTVDTIGSDFDTVLGVYTGGEVSTTAFVAADDDGGGSLTSRVTFKTSAGTTYRIAVDGFGGSAGRISLQLALQGAGGPPPAPAAIGASQGDFTNRVRVDWTAVSGATAYRIHRGTSRDFAQSSVLADAVPAGIIVYDDTAAVAKTVYYYWVVARGGSGDSPPAGPAAGFASREISGNDNFNAAAELAGTFDYTTAVSTSATAEPGEPAHAGNEAAKSLWWKWTAPAGGSVTFSTKGSDFDTVLAVYTGPSLTALELVVANDNDDGGATSRVVFSAIAGETYRIAVDGSRGAAGTVRLGLRPADSLDGDVALAGNLDFGTVGVGQSQARSFTISNTGSQNVSVAAINLPEGFTGDWSGGSLPVGASRSVQVTFAPQEARSYGGSLAVLYGADSLRSFPVSGTGVDDTVPPDTVPPVITLIGADPLEVDPGVAFIDPGARVTDNVDAERVITGTGAVNTAFPGTYTLTYTAQDAAGNQADPVTRTVIVRPDTVPPVISLRGADPLKVPLGSDFTDPGADVTDNLDPERFITGTGAVDVSVPGTYTLRYTAQDAAGNEATSVTRRVIVEALPPGSFAGVFEPEGEGTVDLERYRSAAGAVTFRVTRGGKVTGQLFHRDAVRRLRGFINRSTGSGYLYALARGEDQPTILLPVAVRALEGGGVFLVADLKELVPGATVNCHAIDRTDQGRQRVNAWLQEDGNNVDESGAPRGHGYATARTLRSGAVAVAGRLPDGRRFAGSSRLVNQGSGREFVLLHALRPKPGQFLLGGNLLEVDVADDGSVAGIGIDGTTERLAWSNGEELIRLSVDGAKWSPSPGQPLFEGMFEARFRLDDGAVAEFTADWPAQGQPFFAARDGSREPLRFSVNRRTGAFRGSVRPDPLSGRRPLRGILLDPAPIELDDGTLLQGAGYSLGPDGSASPVEITTRP